MTTGRINQITIFSLTLTQERDKLACEMWDIEVKDLGYFNIPNNISKIPLK
jgi:hypothetical protein